MRGPTSRPLVLASSHDVELAALASSGDRTAFGELVRRHGRAIRGLLRRLGAEPVLADALAQDAVLEAFEQIRDFRGEGPFQAWAKRIAARLYLKRCRKEVRAWLLEAAAQVDRDRRTDDHAPLTLDAALQVLSPAQRLCVSLCYGAGLSHADAADAAQDTPVTIRAHLRCGLDGLRADLAPDEADFETRLDRLFAENPALDGDDAFISAVDRRLNRAWGFRQVLIGGLGVVGGLIGVGQVAASGVIGRAAIISTQSARVMSIVLADHLPGRLLAGGLPLGGGFLWAGAAFALIAVGLVVLRALGDI